MKHVPHRLLRSMRHLRLFILILWAGCTAVASEAAVEARQDASAVTLSNERITVRYDLTSGTWSAAENGGGGPILASAISSGNEFSSSAANATRTCVLEPLHDALGVGRSAVITTALANGPKLLLRISVYEQQPFIALATGLENTTDHVIQLKRFGPLEGAAFSGFETNVDYSTLDGSGGGGATFVSHEFRKRTSRNNLLVTFGRGASRRSLVMGGLTYRDFEKNAQAERKADASLAIHLWAEDPVGKRIDPGVRYLPDDRFYVDFSTANPFDALEKYADSLRLAQEIVLNVCRFPIVDTWFAQVPHFGGGEDKSGYRGRNDSVGAVEEMECVARSGFLKYAPVAVLLEPDLYDANNQQGWWDDEHWRRGPSNRARGAGAWESSHGQFVPPYETAQKWAGAIKSLGGIPMIYVQTGFRSQDYAEKFPQNMLFQQPNAPYLNEKGEQQFRDKEKKQPRKMGYDYTSPGFQHHMREVWEHLRLAGVQGVKFDYPDLPFTGWPHGGMSDPYSTTAMHYRTIFRLAHDGLGPDCYLHERALDRGSDVTLGLVTSQRTEGDTDQMNAGMVSRVGLRWYKNRVVINYDMDGKNPFHANPANRDGERAIWTMAYVAGGTLMLSPSFGRMTPEQIRDLSRIYPFHSARQSARPVDAFTSKYPRVYNYRVNDAWHQLTFYNTDSEHEAKIGVALSGDTAAGTLGLAIDRNYYVYDFWNDRLVGKFPGNKSLEQTLRPGEARMFSIHEAADHPQFLSTDRHLMQGYVDLLGCEWDAAHNELHGVSGTVAGEAYRIQIATNGYTARSATVDSSILQSVARSRPGAAAAAEPPVARLSNREADLVELTLTRADGGPVAWTVKCEPRPSTRPQ